MTPTDIETAHQRLGYKLGWRFHAGPAANHQRATVAIVGLNPGGDTFQPSMWSQESGSSYVVERWKGRNEPGSAPLQVQVRSMCELLRVDPAAVFGAYFVPFRSGRWSELPNRREALEFARRLWRWALPISPARTIICLGKDVTGEEIAGILGVAEKQSIPSGWGDYTIDRYVTKDGRIVIGLLHLGTYKLFSRAESRAAFLRAIQPKT
jgi:hypothetical protein